MAMLKDFQKDAIETYLAVCPLDQNGVVGLWAGSELSALVKKIRSQAPWGDLLSDFDVMDLTIRRLSRISAKLPREYVGLLKDAPGGDGLVAEAKDGLVQFLESLPRSYFVYFPLTSVPTIGKGELSLTPEIAIIDTGFTGENETHLISQNTSAGLLAAMTGRESSSLLENTRYVRIRASGYATASLTTDVATYALAQLKHFIFILLARNVFKQERFWGRPPKLLPMVISYADPLDKDQYGLSIPEEMGRLLARLQPDIDHLRFFDTSNGRGLLLGEHRVPSTPLEFSAAINDQLGLSREFLSIPRDVPDMVRVKAAIEWWVDGLTSENQTISFLQFCIGFEALLGETTDNGGGRSADRGVTERLSDRYAYLLGRTQSEREAHRTEFKVVYQRRGQIVHQRETHLRRTEDADACSDAQRMLFNAIAEELNSLMKAVSKQK